MATDYVIEVTQTEGEPLLRTPTPEQLTWLVVSACDTITHGTEHLAVRGMGNATIISEPHEMLHFEVPIEVEDKGAVDLLTLGVAPDEPLSVLVLESLSRELDLGDAELDVSLREVPPPVR